MCCTTYKLSEKHIIRLYRVWSYNTTQFVTFPFTTSGAEFHLVLSHVEAHPKFPLAQRMSRLVRPGFRLFSPQSVSLWRKELIYLQSSKEEFTTAHNVHCTFPAPADRSTQRDGTWVKVHVSTLFYCIWSIWSEKVQQTPMNQEIAKNEATFKLSDKTKSFLSCAHSEIYYFPLSYSWRVSCLMLVYKKLWRNNRFSLLIWIKTVIYVNIYFNII